VDFTVPKRSLPCLRLLGVGRHMFKYRHVKVPCVRGGAGPCGPAYGLQREEDHSEEDHQRGEHGARDPPADVA
jgi:hypothetical protein